MRLLVLDASLDRCLVALVEDGRVLAEAQEPGAHGQPARLPPLLEAVLAQGAPAGIAACVGPGSFTGIRTALALAHGLALARALPLCGVTVGEALQAEAGPGWPVWSATENRRGALFLEGAGPPRTVAEAALPRPDGPVRLAGDGAPRAAARLLARGATAMLTELRRPSARGLALAGAARRAGALPPRAAEPLYLDPPATT
ncbi:tRNA (adenosine(37)-N6)-threonylcarbamoyltransferase complex dimerization subunit type 1 TsaB [Roseococcus sp. DSY-14]|uniref:tRNA (adenosine(37)-N6)-threonylcarbamoyltransferase complex dimerization subunit type 1 TsaB n=1 Tax=Roseococcus sp. DSY-14 TaxID=3369650 RepID=UPI00387AD0EC